MVESVGSNPGELAKDPSERMEIMAGSRPLGLQAYPGTGGS